MRLFLALLPLLAVARLPAQADAPVEPPAPAVATAAAEADDPLAAAPPLLADAIRRYAADNGRWAYTQRTVEYDGKGREKESRVYRHDPSQHYDEQWTLLERDGKPPTAGQQERFRKRMAKRPERERRALGELLTWSAARVVAETPDAITYEVPLRQTKEQRFPPEKFEVFVELDRTGPAPALRRIDLKLRDSLRVVGVVKIKSGEARLDFTRVLPDRGPVVTAVDVRGAGSILLVPVGNRATVARTDIKRVTPYDERFQVKIEPLKTLDF